MTTQGPQTPDNPHLITPTDKPRARSLGLRFRGTPGAHNAITDVPSIEVGYQTAVLNSLTANQDMTSRDGHRSPPLASAA